MSYDKKLTIKKGYAGAADGSMAAVVAAAVVVLVKNVVTMDPATENGLAGIIAIAVSALAVACRQALGNWMKHRKDK